MTEKHEYLIVGFGRLGRHLSRYFDLLKLSHSVATRKTPYEERRRLALNAKRILICVPDRWIAQIATEWKSLSPEAKLVHFSGSSSEPGLDSAHPLAALSDRELSLDEYQQIFFALEPGRKLEEILPGLPNQSFAIRREDRAAYHCLCVLLGNGTTTLWEQTQVPGLSLPPEVLQSYLANISKNLNWGFSKRQSVLTGPWVRGDSNTIQKHLSVLRGTTLTSLYSALRDLAGGKS